jgi:butyryl-CoA dehydrogenase
MDLVTRKIGQSEGKAMERVLAGFRETARRLATLKDPAFGAIAPRLNEGIDALERATTHLRTALGRKPNDALAGATPYARLFGLVAGTAYLAEAAQASRLSMATGNDDPAHLARIAIARFFAENILPQAGGLERVVVSGAESVMQSDFVLSA